MESCASFMMTVRPDMRYCFRSGRCRPNPRTEHISVPPRHMTKSYIPDFNMISRHYRYNDTTSHTIGIQVPEYITTAEDTCLSTDYKQSLAAKVKHTKPTYTRVQALRPGTPSYSSSSLREGVQKKGRRAPLKSKVVANVRGERRKGVSYINNQITNFSQ